MQTNSGMCRRLLTLAVIAGCGLGCGSAFAAAGGLGAAGSVVHEGVSPTHVVAPMRVTAPSGATRSQYVTVAGATALGNGDRVTGAAPLTTEVPITVTLSMRNATQLKAYISKPHAPMSEQQLATDYLPTTAQVQQVRNYLLRNGFRHISVSPDNLLVHAVGSTMAVQQAFQTGMVNVHTLDGRTAFANSSPIRIPVGLKPIVVAVLGLQNVHEFHTAHADTKRVTADATEIAGHFTPEFASIYDAASLPAATDINVAVWGWGSMAQTITDLGTWLAANPTVKIGSTNTATVVCTDVGGTENPTTGVITGGMTVVGDDTCGGAADAASSEWDMDSQTILGMTGGVKSLTFYSALDPSELSLEDSLDAIVTPPAGIPMAQVINASFDRCELVAGPAPNGDGAIAAMDTLFQKADAQGQTVSVAEGDSGYDQCAIWLSVLPNPAAYNPDESAGSPADSPYVVGVSGTTLRTTVPAAPGDMPAWARENVFFYSGGAPSSLEAAAPYQAALTYGAYAGQRGPDVAFDANGNTGAIFYGDGYLMQGGGTSLSAPLFAGAWARILEADKGNPTPLGFAGPHLYALPASDFHDIVAGNNRGYASTGGYIARRGWDWASGRGSLDIAKAAASLAQ